MSFTKCYNLYVLEKWTVFIDTKIYDENIFSLIFVLSYL